jgi:hypothetical protein
MPSQSVVALFFIGGATMSEEKFVHNDLALIDQLAAHGVLLQEISKNPGDPEWHNRLCAILSAAADTMLQAHDSFYPKLANLLSPY